MQVTALVMMEPAVDIITDAVFTNFVVSLLLCWNEICNNVVANKLFPCLCFPRNLLKI